jgi:hypothetical protein
LPHFIPLLTATKIEATQSTTKTPHRHPRHKEKTRYGTIM